MYKRVDRRRKKQEEEEALGLDEDMKDVLGMHDTDSDESESSSDDDDSDAGSERDEEDEDDASNSLDGLEDGLEGEPPMSIADALEDPIYVVSLDPEVFSCIICPEKDLKNLAMVKVHKTSTAHQRRHARFVEIAANADRKTDPRAVTSKIQAEVQAKTDVANSKRAEKRKTKLAVIKAKREKQKFARRKAKEEKARKQAEGSADAKDEPSQPSKKRRKGEDGTAVNEPSRLQPTRQSIGEPEGVKDKPKQEEQSQMVTSDPRSEKTSKGAAKRRGGKSTFVADKGETIRSKRKKA